MITVETAIHENAVDDQAAEELKAKAKAKLSVQKIMERDTAKEKKFFNQKALYKYNTEVSNEDMIDPCIAVIRIAIPINRLAILAI